MKEEFLNTARSQGVIDSEGSFHFEAADLRAAISRHLHGSDGFWLAALLQAFTKDRAEWAQLEAERNQLRIRWKCPTSVSLPQLHNRLQKGDHLSQWSRPLMAVPPQFSIRWTNESGTLRREEEEWFLEPYPGDKSLSVISPNHKDWSTTIATAAQLFPFPTFPLEVPNHQWSLLGASSILFHYRSITGTGLEIWTPRLKGEFGGLVRLGLCKKPDHQLHILQHGVIVHSVELPFTTHYLQSRIFLTVEELETDLSGLKMRENEENMERVGTLVELGLTHLRSTYSKLISQPTLPLNLENRQRAESSISSAIALGGLAFLQLPLAHPAITLGIAAIIAGGVGVKTQVDRHRRPWVSEVGVRKLRRDLVEARKVIDKGCIPWGHTKG